jgi:HEAT repeat protein/Na+/melibiose symporter-like transporter
MTDAVPEGLSASQRRTGQRAAIRTNLFGQGITYVMTGAVMMLFAGDVLGLSASRIAQVLAVIPLVALGRIFVLPLLRRLGYVRTLLLTDIGRLAVVVTLLILPARALSFPLYLGLLLVFSAASQLGGGTVWQPLMRDITTVNDRGRFFARMRLLFTLVGTVVTAIVPLLVGTALTEAQYKLLLVIPLVGLFSHTLFVRRIPEPAHASDASDTPNLRAMLRALRSSPLLRRPLLIFIAVQFSLFPLLPVYLRQVLGIPSNLVSTYLFCVSLGSAASFALFGRISDSMGFKPLLIGVLVIASVASPLYLLITPIAPGWMGLANAGWPERLSVISLFVMGFITGSVSAGAGLGLTSIQHYYVSSRDSLVSMNAFSSLTVLIVSAQSLLYGLLIENVAGPLGNIPIIPGYLSADAVKIYLVLGATIFRSIAVFVAGKLPNLRAFFGLSDFFSALSPASIRSMFIGRRTAHDDEGTRLVAARRMGLQTTPLGVDPLLSLLEDPSYDVKVEAIRALATTSSEIAGARLLEELERDEMAVLSDHIAWALGELRYAPATKALIARSTDTARGPRLRAAAARALGKIGDLNAVRPLTDIARGEQRELIRAAAMIALIRMADRGGLRECLEVLPTITGSLTERELLFHLCRRYSLPTGWLLALARGTAARAALLDYVEQRPVSWQRRRSRVVEAVRLRDHARVSEAAAQLSSHADTRAQSLTPEDRILLECATRIGAWTPLAKLVALWLLEHGQG